MLSLLLQANTKRCFTHYFGVRIYSPPIQRKGSRETYCYLSVYQDVGQRCIPGERRGDKVCIYFLGSVCSAKSTASLSCCPLLPSWKASSCAGLKLCCQRLGLPVAWVCHPRTGVRSEKFLVQPWGMTLVLLQDQGFPRTGMGVLGQQFLWIKCRLEVQHNHMV